MSPCDPRTQRTGRDLEKLQESRNRSRTSGTLRQGGAGGTVPVSRKTATFPQCRWVTLCVRPCHSVKACHSPTSTAEAEFTEGG